LTIVTSNRPDPYVPPLVQRWKQVYEQAVKSTFSLSSDSISSISFCSCCFRVLCALQRWQRSNVAEISDARTAMHSCDISCACDRDCMLSACICRQVRNTPPTASCRLAVCATTWSRLGWPLIFPVATCPRMLSRNWRWNVLVVHHTDLQVKSAHQHS
jgi:hypothetical protein